MKSVTVNMFTPQQSRGVSPRSGAARPGSARAFTLIELMISIALVLFLILGVNQVFTYTTQAVGAGEAVNAAIRASRAAQATFASDFSGIVPNGSGPNDSPCIIISSHAVYSYRNAKDQAAEGVTPTALPAPAYLDLAGTGKFGDTTVNGDTVYPSTYNFRNHRLDSTSFFARGQFPRQTGNDGTFVDNMSSQEAWISYGHLWLPDNAGGFHGTTYPCAGSSATNPNNYFGSQLVLGRAAILLKTAPIKDNQGYLQNYYDYGSSWASVCYACKDTPIDSSQSFQVHESRYDVANGSISRFNANLAVVLSTNWWSPLIYNFEANPFVSKPMSALAMAQASPYFLGGCSQFIVEYAGDFVTQDNNPNSATYGHIIAPSGPALTDGQIDYTILPNGSKQIKWYGMPRNTSGQPGLIPTNGDVAPLYSWLAYDSMAANYSTYSFEKGTHIAYKTNYSGLSGMSQSEAAVTGYIAAFGPNDPTPKLIRITMTLEDPTGRLPEGQTYQYVFAVPQP